MNFDLSVCTLSERDEDGFVRCQAEPYGSEGTAPSREVFLPFGLLGRPKARAQGIGASVFVMRQGDDVRAMPGPDPRWMSALPDFGDGGMPLYATTERNGSRVAPYLAFFGDGAAGGEAEGLFRLHVPAGSGQTRIEIEPSAGDVAITHASGTKLNVKAAAVELGADGGAPLVKETGSLAAFFAAVVSAFSGLGVTISPPTGYTCTKVNGT